MGAELGRLQAQVNRAQAQAIAQEAVSTMVKTSTKTISWGVGAAIAATTVSGMLLYTVAGGNFRDSLRFIPYYIGIGAIAGGSTLGAVAWVNKNQVIVPLQPRPSQPQPKVEVQQAPQRDRELESQMATIARALIDIQGRLDDIETQPTPEPEPTGLEEIEQAHAEAVDSAEIDAELETMKGRNYYTYYPSVI